MKSHASSRAAIPALAEESVILLQFGPPIISGSRLAKCQVGVGHLKQHCISLIFHKNQLTLGNVCHVLYSLIFDHKCTVAFGYEKMKMENLATNSSNRSITHRMGHPTNYSKNDCRGEIRDLFKKLSAWREESQIQFSNIVNAHGNSIEQGINDLVKEICDLKAKFALITKERDYLLEKVNNSNHEARQQNCTSQIIIPFLRPELHCDQDTQEVVGTDCEIPHAEKQAISNENGDNEEHIKIEDTADQAFEEENNDPLNDSWDHVNDKALNEMTYVEMNDVEEGEVTENQVDKPNQEQKGIEGISEDNVTSEEHKYVDGPEGNKTVKKPFECGSCPYTTARLIHMNYHIDGVHKKIRNHTCQECEYSASRKSSLKNHVRRVHEKTRNHSCDMCGYAASEWGNMKKHIESVHKIRERKPLENLFRCEHCSYATAKTQRMKDHIDGVHKKIRNNVCEECGYAATRKTTLKRHMEAVHEKIRKYVCAECGYAFSENSNLQKHKKIKGHM